MTLLTPPAIPSSQRPDPELPQGRLRWSALACTALLAACSSTPLPPWPTSSKPQVATPTRPAPEIPVVPQATTQPIAPANNLVPLPYNAAVAARFPDPATRYDTPGLAPQRNQFTTASELSSWLNSQASKSLGRDTRLGIVQPGSSQRGSPIQALVATRAPGIQPSALYDSRRPTVMLVAGQHGDEPAGTEALLIIARELAPGGLLEPLLQQINVILVPRANPDAVEAGTRNAADGTDIAHDHLLLNTPEAKALATLARDYRPVAVVDLQEFPAASIFLQKYQAIQRYDALLQYSATANQNEFVTKAAREWYTAPLRTALSQAGLSSDWYYTTSQELQDKSISMGSLAPDSLRNISGLKNSVGYLVSSRGSDLGRAHIQRRVHTLVTAATRMLHSSAERAKDLTQVQAFVARETASLACHQQLAVQAEQTPEQRTLTMIQPDTGADQQVRVDWNASLQARTTLSRPRSCGYWLSASAQTAVDRLRLLGLQVLKVAEPGQLLADSYNEARSATPASGAYALTRGAVEAPVGSYYLSMNQPMANIAAAALEPDTPYSYLARGLVPTLSDMARVMAPPSVVFEEEEDAE
ncbi:MULTISPECIES: M14 family metallopeptidase [Delftia]|uniref:Zinc carboxypeptidase n=2 Tax=Delftia TaxID=80865 RepID=A0A1H3T429_9BURK|nr:MULTISPECIES: M14 family metallocarboxypeptidase [Delftia]MDC2858555.1 M14 family zinc carboxypeptidase [Delftia sp. DT-2]MDH0772614.1 M14 family zinc carboxypeptidase [Delftia tsuruhatensis]MDH1456909.1 M14 family zinc carboxypeptidase [Delftia tsuruhatensis]MDH1821702.1 M14 family zinc carboxypeptidase [Delftia tsuruhatensis]MPT02748.1 peptidase M14 [Delftia sp.]